MNPIEIRHAIERQGITLAQIGQDIGKTRQAVSGVVRGTSRSRAIEACIGVLLGRPLAEIWPQWHGAVRRRRSNPIPVAARLAALEAALRKTS